jgi:polyisoprenoid-binding protein YceI
MMIILKRGAQTAVGLCVLLVSVQNGLASIDVEFGPGTSKIQSSVSCTLIGRYTAGFSRYKGTLRFDHEGLVINSVFLEIETASLYSGYPRLDKIVLSPRLLDARTYPVITFRSERITKEHDRYQATGYLVSHGFKKKVMFPFDMRVDRGANGCGRTVMASGKWHVPRKDFGIIWSPVLDKGGVVVGNDIVIDWQIHAPLTACPAASQRRQAQ